MMTIPDIPKPVDEQVSEILSRGRTVWIGRDSARGAMQYQLMIVEPVVKRLRYSQAFDFQLPRGKYSDDMCLRVHLENSLANVLLLGRRLSAGEVDRLELRRCQ